MRTTVAATARLSILAIWLVGAATSPTPGAADPGLQQRIDALPAGGGEVRLAAGPIVVEHPILLRSGTRIIGSGAETVLIAGPDMRGPVFTDRDWAAGCADVEISALTIDGRAATRAPSRLGAARRGAAKALDEVEEVAIYLQRAADVRLHGVQITQFHNEGIFLVQCRGVAITDCAITESARKGKVDDWSQGAIYLRGSSRCLIADNTLTGCYEGGIIAGLGSDDNCIARNRIRDCASGEGVFIGGGNRNIVVDNRIEGVSHADRGTGAGIAISVPPGIDADKTQAAENLILRNTIAQVGGSGISLFHAERNLIIGNTVESANDNRNPGKGGISAWESADPLLYGNHILRSQCPAIIIHQADAAVVVDNRMEGNAAPQVRVDGKSRGVIEQRNVEAP